MEAFCADNAVIFGLNILVNRGLEATALELALKLCLVADYLLSQRVNNGFKGIRSVGGGFFCPEEHSEVLSAKKFIKLGELFLAPLTERITNSCVFGNVTDVHISASFADSTSERKLFFPSLCLYYSIFGVVILSSFFTNL